MSGIVSDVTERRRLEDDLQRSMRQLERARAEAELRAGTDELTGTFNRRHFAQIAAESLTTDPGHCGLLLLDADHFKQINDAYGHAVGDAVLVDLARRLRSQLDPGDCLARWGGEEFAVLLHGVGSDRELDERAQRFRRAVSETPIAHEAARLQLTISIGGALGAQDGTSLDALVDQADALPLRGQAPGPKPRIAASGRQRRRRVDPRARGRRHGPGARVRKQPAGGHPRGARRAGGGAGDAHGGAPRPARGRRAALPPGRVAARRRQADACPSTS